MEEQQQKPNVEYYHNIAIPATIHITVVSQNPHAPTYDETFTTVGKYVTLKHNENFFIDEFEVLDTDVYVDGKFVADYKEPQEDVEW